LPKFQPHGQGNISYQNLTKTVVHDDATSITLTIQISFVNSAALPSFQYIVSPFDLNCEFCWQDQLLACLLARMSFFD